MNRQELIDALNQLNWPKQSYTFDTVGVGAHDVDVLKQHDSNWSWYYYERGQASLVQHFGSEAELYRYYLDNVMKQLDQLKTVQSQAEQKAKDEFSKTIRQQAIALALEGEESVAIEDLKAWTYAEENFQKNKAERYCTIAIAQYHIREKDKAIATLSLAIQSSERVLDLNDRYSLYKEIAQIQNNWGDLERAKQTFLLAGQTILPYKPAKYRWIYLRHLAKAQFKAGFLEEAEATIQSIANEKERVAAQAEIEKLTQPQSPKTAPKLSPLEIVLQTLHAQGGGIESALQQTQGIQEAWFRCEAFCRIAQEQWRREQIEAAQNTFKLARKEVFQINVHDKGYLSGSDRKGGISMGYSMAFLGQAQAEVGAIEAAKATFAEATSADFGMNVAKEFGWTNYYDPEPIFVRLINIAEALGRLGWLEAEATFQQAIHIVQETDFGGTTDEMIANLYQYLREIAEAQARVGYLGQAQQTAQLITDEHSQRDKTLSSIVEQAVLHNEWEIALNIATTIKDYISRFNSLMKISFQQTH